MFDIASSAITSMANSTAGSALRSVKMLLASAVFWTVGTSLLDHEQPAALLQHVIDWLGSSWSVDPAVSWIHERSDAASAVAALLAIVATGGVLLGADAWVNFTHGPLGLAFAVLLLREVSAPASAIALVVISSPLLAILNERRIGSGLLVLASPLVYLAAPFFVTADLLGFNRTPRAVQPAPGGRPPLPLPPKTAE